MVRYGAGSKVPLRSRNDAAVPGHNSVSRPLSGSTYQLSQPVSHTVDALRSSISRV